MNASIQTLIRDAISSAYNAHHFSAAPDISVKTKKALILKMISDGESGNSPSMARLLRAMSITLRGQWLHRQEPYMI